MSNRPNCYIPNNDPYPLCIGSENEICKQCCLCEYMIEGYIDEK